MVGGIAVDGSISSVVISCTRSRISFTLTFSGLSERGSNVAMPFAPSFGVPGGVSLGSAARFELATVGLDVDPISLR